MNAVLTQAQERLDALRQQHERALADANLPDPNADAIANLRDDIETVKADAYLAGKQPDVSKLEAQITALRKKSAAADATREAAQGAVPVLAARIAECDAEVERLTLEHYSAALESELGAYREHLAQYMDAAKALITALAQVQASVHTAELLSERLGRPTGYAAFLMNDLLGQLKLPMEVRPGSWYPVSGWDAVTEQARPLREERVRRLAAEGIDVAGPKLVKQKAPEATAPIEPREVRIIVNGTREELGPRVVQADHVGLIESVTH